MTSQGRIIKRVGGLFSVLYENGTTADIRCRGILKKMDVPPVPGDFVTVEDDVIISVKERKNVLIRPAVANIDKLFIIVAFQKPDPDFLYIDKLTAISEHYNIVPILIFNKSDYSDIYGLISNYSLVPYRKYIINAKDNTGIDSLYEEIEGSTCVLAGYSGVGKSSFMNCLFEKYSNDISCKTGEISDKISRGKHTTTWSELYPINNGFVVDTPGFSTIELEYYDMFEKETIVNCFPEMEPFSTRCRFSDCHHLKEKECAVKKAVDEGLISLKRYESYKAIYESIKEKEF